MTGALTLQKRNNCNVLARLEAFNLGRYGPLLEKPASVWRFLSNSSHHLDDSMDVRSIIVTELYFCYRLNLKVVFVEMTMPNPRPRFCG